MLVFGRLNSTNMVADVAPSALSLSCVSELESGVGI